MRRLFSIAAMALAVAAMAFVVGLVRASPASADGDDDGDDRVLCTGPLTGTIDGDLIVPTGASCELTDAHVKGDVVVQPSALLAALNSSIEGDVDCSAGFVPPDGVFFCDLLSGTVVEGNGIARAGGELHLHGGTILGNVRATPDSVFFTTLSIPGLPDAAPHIGGNVRCERCFFLDLAETTVGGNVQIRSEADGSFIAENNEISGDLEILGSQAGNFAFIIAGNAIHGSVEFKRNVGPTVIERNIIDGDLEIAQNNVAGAFCPPDSPDPCPIFEDGHFNDNQVGGDMSVVANQGPTEIVGNVVAKELECKRNDPAPVGSGNTAREKEGQCKNL